MTALSLSDLKGKRIGMFASGGLDSRTLATVLTEEGAEVISYTANLGQPDEENFDDILKRMRACGVQAKSFDARNDMADAALKVIRAQARYDGGYWNSTGIGRAITVQRGLREMLNDGCNVMMHGATGRGNDQFRFERYATQLSKDIVTFAPWRNPVLVTRFPGRLQMVEYLQSNGQEASVGQKKRYSTDSNLAGLSNEADDLESLETPMNIVKPIMCKWPWDAPDHKRTFKISFEDGLPFTINDSLVEPDPIMALSMANDIGGNYGIGLRHALENRMVGSKSRGVYEAPGMELLGQCFEYLLQAVLDRESRQQYNQLSTFLGQQIYHAKWFDHATISGFKAVEELTSCADGMVTVELYKGNIFFVSLTDVPHSLYREADASMEASDGLNPVSSQGHAEVLNVLAAAQRDADQVSFLS